MKTNWQREWRTWCGTLVVLAALSGGAAAHGWLAPEEAAKRPNPLEATTENLALGQERYATYCSSCHGEKATGLPASTTGLDQDSPDLVVRLANHTPGDFHWKVLEGRGEMPPFAGELSDQEVWAIILYLESLAP